MSVDLMHPIIFLDTTTLLIAFARYHKGQELPSCLKDLNATRFTFEKCIYESHMAFRGVGGKKPDEGRQNWAKNSLDKNVDSRSLDFLINKYHDKDIQLAHYWVNQIQEFDWTIIVFNATFLN